MKTSKILLAVLACILTMISSGYSQSAWVKDVARNARNIEAAKEATAIVLHNVAEVKISNRGNAKTKIQVAYKILTSDGEQFGVMSVPVYPFLKVKSLKGWLIWGDNSSKSLAKENIVTVSVKESAGYYDDSQLLIASLPDVEPGVIVAFELTTEEKGFTSLYQSFVFQTQQPVKFAQYSVKIPKNWQLIKAEWRTEDVHFEQQENRYVWTANDLPYQPEEPLAPSWYYLSRRISVTCFDPKKKEANHFVDWSSVANWCANVFHEPAVATDEIISESRKLIEGATTFEEKIRAIAAFSQDDIRYVAVEISKGRWKPRTAAMTLFNRYGDCKDKTTLMRAMLQAADIRSVPVLASVSYPVDLRLPTLFQFDHCIIAIPIEEERPSPQFQNAIVNNWLFFDPTDPSTQIGKLPWALQGGTVLLGVHEDSVLFRLPYRAPQDYRRVYRTKAQLYKDGSFSADVTITDIGNWAARTRYIHRITPKKKRIEDWYVAISQTVPFVELTNYQTAGNGDSVWVSFTIKGEGYIQKTGNLFLLRLDLFHTAEAPLLTADERQHPVWFGPPKEIESNVRWHLPDNWVAEVDTTTIQSDCEAASIFSKMMLLDDTLRFVTINRQKGRLIWPEEYESARKFSKDLSSVRGQIVLLKKRQSGGSHE